MNLLIFILPLSVLVKAERCADYTPVPIKPENIASGWAMVYASEDPRFNCTKSYYKFTPGINTGKLYYNYDVTSDMYSWPYVIWLVQLSPGKYYGIGPNGETMQAIYRMYKYNVSPDGKRGYYCLMACDASGNKAKFMNCHAITKKDFSAIDREIRNIKVDLSRPMNVIWNSSC